MPARLAFLSCFSGKQQSKANSNRVVGSPPLTRNRDNKNKEDRARCLALENSTDGRVRFTESDNEDADSKSTTCQLPETVIRTGKSEQENCIDSSEVTKDETQEETNQNDEDSNGLLDRLVTNISNVLPWNNSEEETETKPVSRSPSANTMQRARSQNKSSDDSDDQPETITASVTIQSIASSKADSVTGPVEKLFEAVTLPWSADTKGITLINKDEEHGGSRHKLNNRSKQAQGSIQSSTLSIESATKLNSLQNSPSGGRSPDIDFRPRSHTMDSHHNKQGKHHKRHFGFRPLNNSKQHVSDHHVDVKTSDKDAKLQILREKYHMDSPAMEHARELGKTYGLTNSHELLGTGQHRPENQDSSGHQRTAVSHGNMAQLRQHLAERGEKVSHLEDTSENMKSVASDWSNNMHQIAEKYKNKKWYEL